MLKNIITIIILLSGVFLMLKLGLWQLERLEWKENIIANIESQESVDAAKTPLNLDQPIENYQRGYLQGAYLNKPAIKIRPKTNDKGQVGFHLVYPFRTTDGMIVLVNNGWHDDGDVQTNNHTNQKLIGFFKSPPRANAFSPENNPAQDRWYRLDIQQVENFYNIQNIYPKIFHVSAGAKDLMIPRPRNNHMQYAIFWFTMAVLLIVLCVIYGFRAKSRSL